MKKAEVVAFFGSQKLTAEALSISEAAVSQWGDLVPAPRQAHVRLAMQEEQRRRDAEEKKAKRKADRGNRAYREPPAAPIN